VLRHGTIEPWTKLRYASRRPDRDTRARITQARQSARDETTQAENDMNVRLCFDGRKWYVIIRDDDGREWRYGWMMSLPDGRD